jgi:2-polyprenyl-3-methyl-5-hydroxy-6-metoxy-1,4-benzoquinol methylase
MANISNRRSAIQAIKAIIHALSLIISILFKWVLFTVTTKQKSKLNRTEMFSDLIANNYLNIAKNKGLEQKHTNILKNIGPYLNTDKSILDYGCGTGTISIEIANMVDEINAIDISSKMIDVAQRRSAQLKISNISFLQSTIFDEKLTKGSFDVVLASGILHLVEDKQKVIKRIYELLKPGGLLLSATECMSEKKSIISILLLFLIKIRLFPFTIQYFNVSELKESMTSNRLSIVRTDVLAENPVCYFIAAKKT